MSRRAGCGRWCVFSPAQHDGRWLPAGIQEAGSFPGEMGHEQGVSKLQSIGTTGSPALSQNRWDVMK